MFIIIILIYPLIKQHHHQHESFLSRIPSSSKLIVSKVTTITISRFEDLRPTGSGIIIIIILIMIRTIMVKYIIKPDRR